MYIYILYMMSTSQYVAMHEPFRAFITQHMLTLLKFVPERLGEVPSTSSSSQQRLANVPVT